MRVIVLGASGLIGHKLFEKLSERFETYGTLKNKIKDYDHPFFSCHENFIENINAHDFSSLVKKLDEINPDVILNCIGITKRKNEVNIPLEVININALLPHKLLKWAKENKKRLIHFSTDCVFNGKDGSYSENSLTNSEDAYGRTKALGEINHPNALTIRSSFVGRELFTNSELLEWFLSENKKEIEGFKHAMYTGVSTIFLAKIVGDIIEYHPNLSGLKQLSIKKSISKFDLLNIAKNSFNKKIDLIPNINFKIDASLNGNKLRNELNYGNPSWKTMMDELASDNKFYKKYN
jgi:dTDP-4-dehydrorhamnose reductase